MSNKAPGPIIWAYAIAVPLSIISGNPVWWPFWIITAMCYWLIGDWAYKKWIRKK